MGTHHNKIKGNGMMLMEITSAVIFLNPQKQQLLYGEGRNGILKTIVLG